MTDPISTPSVPLWKKPALWLWSAAFLLPMAAFSLMRFFMLRTGDCSGDSFYHIGMAKLGAGAILSRTFPWLELSVWHDRFANKEMLYQLFLSLVVKLQELAGFVVEPPFHFASIILVGIVLLSFGFAAKQFRLTPLTALAGSLLAVLVIPNFSYRLAMIRPHVFSLALMLLMIGCLARGSFRFRLFAVSGISFLYAWSYSNPHFIVIPVLFLTALEIFRGSWKTILLPAASLLAVLLGLLIHPQFPNSLIIWKLQSIDALFSPMLANNPLPRPGEMLPPAIPWHLSAIPLYLLVYCNVLCLIRLVERVGWRKIEPPLAGLAALSLFFTAGMCAALRAVEYAAPFTVLTLLILFDRLRREDLLIPFRKTRFGSHALLAAFSLAAAGLTFFQSVTVLYKAEAKPVPGVARYLEEHTAPGEVVVNVDWSDFPRLFYSTSRPHWLWGMDPVFSLLESPGKVKTMLDLRPMRGPVCPPARLGAVFQARYAVLLNPRYVQAAYLKQKGWTCVYEGDDGWVFRLR